MRHLTEQERKEIEFIRDMLNGNINRMCVADTIKDMHKQVEYARYAITTIMDIVEKRFTDQT